MNIYTVCVCVCVHVRVWFHLKLLRCWFYDWDTYLFICVCYPVWLMKKLYQFNFQKKISFLFFLLFIVNSNKKRVLPSTMMDQQSFRWPVTSLTNFSGPEI